MTPLNKIISMVSLTLVVMPFSVLAQEVEISDAPEQVVNLYSARHYQTDEALYTEFTQQTGIRVNRIEASGDVLIERMKNEANNSPADVYMSVDAGTLWRAENEGIFAPVSSDILNARIPENIRHPEGLWFGFSTRARVIVYNKELVSGDDVLRYEDLADEDLNGMVCIRSSSNIYNLSLMASLIKHHGAEGAEEWAKAVVGNFARDPQGGDTDQIRAVASGECGVALANSYYYARLMLSDDPQDQAVVDATAVIFPNQHDRGAHVNISGAGLAANAPHPENAVRFLEYLSSPSAQKYFAGGSNEYPAVDGLLENPALLELGAFKADKINVSVYGINQPEAQRVFDRAGWK